MILLLTLIPYLPYAFQDTGSHPFVNFSMYHPKVKFPLFSTAVLPSTKGGLVWDEYLKAILPAQQEHHFTSHADSGDRLGRASLVVKVFSGVAGLFLCLTFRIEGLHEAVTISLLKFSSFLLLLTALKIF